MELFDVYSLYPVEPVRGSGSYVYDAAGTEYLDLYGGHAVISIGHAHPHYVRMISGAEPHGWILLQFGGKLVCSTRWPSGWEHCRVTTTTAFSSATRAPKPTKTP